MTPETPSFPLKTRTYIELTRKAIDGNRCDRVPAVYLVSGSTPSACDSVIYELDTEAARAYSFRTRDPVTGVSERARKYAGQLVVKRISDSAVEVRLACDSSASCGVLKHAEPRSQADTVCRVTPKQQAT